MNKVEAKDFRGTEFYFLLSKYLKEIVKRSGKRYFIPAPIFLSEDLLEICKNYLSNSQELFSLFELSIEEKILISMGILTVFRTNTGKYQIILNKSFPRSIIREKIPFSTKAVKAVLYIKYSPFPPKREWIDEAKLCGFLESNNKISERGEKIIDFIKNTSDKRYFFFYPNFLKDINILESFGLAHETTVGLIIKADILDNLLEKRIDLIDIIFLEKYFKYFSFLPPGLLDDPIFMSIFLSLIKEGFTQREVNEIIRNLKKSSILKPNNEISPFGYQILNHLFRLRNVILFPAM